MERTRTAEFRKEAVHIGLVLLEGIEFERKIIPRSSRNPKGESRMKAHKCG